jgi:hypothetical protein
MWLPIAAMVLPPLILNLLPLEAQAWRERRGMQSLERRQRRIARIAAAPGIRAVGPLLRRTFQC